MFKYFSDNDILPAEIQDIAGQEIQDLPYDSATWRSIFLTYF